MKAQSELVRQIQEHMDLMVNSIKSKLQYQEVTGEYGGEWTEGFDQGVLETNQFYLDMISRIVAEQEA